jgi:uncharacterized hydrophobic protein (TIGR00341 family)
VWTSRSSDSIGLARILVDAEDTESLCDLLVRNFGWQEGFRLILLPVEATLPSIEVPTEEEATSKIENEQKPVGPKRISREELYEDISQASKLKPVFVITVALSTVVAAVGLIRGDVAIIIGAMVIAPLLGPNIALSLASTLGDPDLAKRCLKAIAVGITTAGVLSLILGAVIDIDPQAPELAARMNADLGDIILALAAGAAGALAFTSGVPAVVVGVMVSVALLPPLVVAGLLVGSGNISHAAGAITLAVTNVTCINLAAVATFLVQKVRPRSFWEAERARHATQIAVATWTFMLAVLIVLMVLGYVGGV